MKDDHAFSLLLIDIAESWGAGSTGNGRSVHAQLRPLTSPLFLNELARCWRESPKEHSAANAKKTATRQAPITSTDPI
jgi:hypothetical protein